MIKANKALRDVLNQPNKDFYHLTKFEIAKITKLRHCCSGVYMSYLNRIKGIHKALRTFRIAYYDTASTTYDALGTWSIITYVNPEEQYEIYEELKRLGFRKIGYYEGHREVHIMLLK